MPITFTTKSYADITMLNDTGAAMLEMMDFGNLIPGAIAATDLHQALRNLQKNLADESEKKDQDKDEDDDQQQPPVSLTIRVLPLLELLKSAKKNGNNVSWR
jgi:hypothetical protein